MSQIQGGFDLPPMSPNTRNLLIALFAMYAAELLLRNGMGVNLTALAWNGFGQGFAPWQPVTRFFIQGNNVYGALFTGLALYLFMPSMERWFSRRQLISALGFAAAGGTLFALAANALGLVHGAAFGLAPLITVMFVLFGLFSPNAIIRLFFVLPIPAKVIAWGTGLLAFLVLLANFDLASAITFGTWLSTIGWWFWLGPGGARRRNRPKPRPKHLTVMKGGRDDTIYH